MKTIRKVVTALGLMVGMSVLLVDAAQAAVWNCATAYGSGVVYGPGPMGAFCTIFTPFGPQYGYINAFLGY